MFTSTARRRNRLPSAGRVRRVPEAAARRYCVRLARNANDVEAALRLRFDVFSRELGQGLADPVVVGLEADEFDAVCDHLVVVDETGTIVGTYRLQTGEMAERGLGFVTDREFDLDAMPHSLRTTGVELGRACIARAHRNTRVLFALWRGIAAYAARCDARMLFGCCSAPGTSPAQAASALEWLRNVELVHETLWAPVRPTYACPPAEPVVDGDPPVLPPLFGMYMRHGARVCGGPALDRSFGTTDFLVVLDVARLETRTFDLFFAAAVA